MTYTIKNNQTGRKYNVNTDHNASIDIVWMSQKSMFLTGCSVTITDENGNKKTFSN